MPYKGSAPALTDVMNGNVNYAVETVAATQTHIKSGKLKAFGVTTAKPAGAMPELPPLAEGAMPGYDAAAWIGYVEPAGTPREPLVRLAAEMQKLLATDEIKSRLVSLGLDARSSTRRRWARTQARSRSATARSSRARTSRWNNRGSKIAGALGAEILGVDLSREIPAGEIRRAFLEHLVIFFRTRNSTRRSSWPSPAAWESRSSIPSSRASTAFPK